MELGEHRQDEQPVPDCDCRRCAVATRDDLRKDAERYRWLRAIPNELRADHDWNPASGGWDAPIYWHGLHKPGDELQGSELDDAIDAAMQGANT